MGVRDIDRDHNGVTERRCSRCRNWKPRAESFSRRTAKYWQSVCKKCHAQYTQATREAKRENDGMSAYFDKLSTKWVEPPTFANELIRSARQYVLRCGLPPQLADEAAGLALIELCQGRVPKAKFIASKLLAMEYGNPGSPRSIERKGLSLDESISSVPNSD